MCKASHSRSLQSVPPHQLAPCAGRPRAFRQPGQEFVNALTLILLIGLHIFFSSAPARAAGEIPGYAVVPLTLVGRANQATIHVTINGQPTHLILDTGASSLVLDSRFYAIAHPKGNASSDELPPGIPRTSTANGEKVNIGYISSMQAGPMDFHNGPVAVLDLSSMLGQYNNYHASGSIAGLMGEDVLRRYSAIIDWRRRGVYFNIDPSKRMKLGPGLVSAGWTAVPMLSTSSRHFAVPCAVSGKPAKLLVDTGAQFTSFAPGIVPLDILYNRDTRGSMVHLASTTSTMSMIGMDTSMHPARVENWKVGNYEIAHSNVAVQKFPANLLSQQSDGDAPLLGLLGSEFLAENNAIIDIGGSTLYLKASRR